MAWGRLTLATGRALPEAPPRRLFDAATLSFVLYRGTAVALHLGHRQSLDFDFFAAKPLAETAIEVSFDFMRGARVLQEEPDTLVIAAETARGPVRLAFFGNIRIGHVNEPRLTSDGVLKAILDRAEAKDCVDIAAMLNAGISFERGLAAFGGMFKSDPALPLRALGFFKDGDLAALSMDVQQTLRGARDRVTAVPEILVRPGLTD